MRVFLLRFVRVGNPAAQLTDMYDTSPESRARGAVYRLLFISIAFIYGGYKEKCSLAFRSYVIKRNIDCCDFPQFQCMQKMFNPLLFGPFIVHSLAQENQSIAWQVSPKYPKIECQICSQGRLSPSLSVLLLWGQIQTSKQIIQSTRYNVSFHLANLLILFDSRTYQHCSSCENVEIQGKLS